MQEPLSQHKVEKHEEKLGNIKVAFNNIDGSYLVHEMVHFTYTNIADELFINCVEPSSHIKKFSCEEIYKQDIIETIQDWYKLKVKELNWIKR